jgi:hypothetical protein
MLSTDTGYPTTTGGTTRYVPSVPLGFWIILVYLLEIAGMAAVRAGVPHAGTGFKPGVFSVAKKVATGAAPVAIRIGCAAFGTSLYSHLYCTFFQIDGFICCCYQSNLIDIKNQ